MADLTAVAQILNQVTHPEDVFGLILPTDNSDEVISAVYRRIARAVHPDQHVATGNTALAQELFEKLGALKQAAEAKVKAGTYGDRGVLVSASAPSNKNSPVVVEVDGKRFVLTEQLYQGDVATLYACAFDGHPRALFKVVRNAEDNDLLENEAAVLKDLNPAAQKEHGGLSSICKLLDSFILEDKRRVNVLARYEGGYTIQQVLKAYPEGIDYRDAAWMLNRILETLTYLHESRNYVHGAIIPTHVLLDTDGHKARILDWCYSVKLPKPGRKSYYDSLLEDDLFGDRHIKAISKDFRSFYPPEVFSKENATAAVDVFMAGRCFQTLLSGKANEDPPKGRVPAAIQDFIRKCLIFDPSKRPTASAARDEFGVILKKLVGSPQFRPFTMPKGPK